MPHVTVLGLGCLYKVGLSGKTVGAGGPPAEADSAALTGASSLENDAYQALASFLLQQPFPSHFFTTF